MAWSSQGEGTDLELYDSFLKEWYMGNWTDLLNNLTTTYKLSRKRIVNFTGREMVMALRTGRTGAYGALALSSSTVGSAGAQALTEPGYQGTTNARIRPKLVMGAIGIPQDVIDSSTDDKGAFYEVVDFEMMGLKTDMANYLDRLMYMGGSSLGGALSSVAVGTPTTFDVTNPYLFHTGQKLEFWSTNTTGATQRTGTWVVESVDRDSNQVAVTGSVTGLVNGDFAYHAGARTTNVALEPLGYEELVKKTNTSAKDTVSGDLLLQMHTGGSLTDDLFNISRDTAATNFVSEWGSTAINVGGATELEFRHMHELLDDIHDNSGGDPTVFLTTRKSRRHITKRMAAPSDQAGTVVDTSQRFMNTTRLKGGFIGAREDMHGQGGSDWILFDDRMPIIVDRYATHDYTSGTDRGTIFAVDTRHCFWALVTDWKWWAPEGRILREATSSSGPQFGVLAHAYLFGEHVVDAPNTCGRLYNFNTNLA